jgi:hypothetical protein
MKSFKYLKLMLILGITTFIISNLLFSDYSGAHDGLTRIGFPFVYLQDTGGKCYDCESIKWFKAIYLLLDLLLFLMLAMILILVLQRKNVSD